MEYVICGHKVHLNHNVTVSFTLPNGRVQGVVMGQKRAQILDLRLGDTVEVSRRHGRWWIERVVLEKRPIDVGRSVCHAC